MSYTSKDMKIGWQQIDGKQVPFVYTQYWSEEEDDWIITSEENRLPVDAQLTGSIGESVDITDSTPIPSDSAKDFVIPSDLLVGYSKVSIYYRRQIGDFKGIQVVSPGISGSTQGFPRRDLDITGEAGSTIGVTDKVDILTDKLTIRVYASSDSDLTIRGLEVFLWKY